MGRPFVVKRREDLLDAEFTAKWQDRQRLASLPRTVLGAILAEFIRSGGPVKVDDIVARLRAYPPGEVTRAVQELDEADMILVDHAHVMIAYPFAGAVTAFRVRLADGRERYAVCAVDALGIAAMLGQPVTIRSQCHHCREPLQIDVAPDGPIGPSDIMVWVGERGDLRKKACTSFCLTLNFFRSAEHLGRWRETYPDVPGAAAVLTEACALGAHLFGTLLPEIVAEAGRTLSR